MAMSDQYPSHHRWRMAVESGTVVFDQALRQHMLKVYNYMMLGLAMTGAVAALVGNTPALYGPIFGSPLKWVVMASPLVFVMVLSWRFERLSAGAVQALFWAFCGVMGLSMASIFMVFTGTSIARVFFIAAAMFAGTSLYGYTTRADLSKLGSFLIMGLIGMVIASLVNIFIGSSMVQFVVSVIGVIVFTGLTAYDTQRIKQEFVEFHAQETAAKLAVMSALTLYLNFINLFQILLNLTGQREE